MVEYALLTAGNVLMPMQLFSERVLSSVSITEALLVLGGAWALWRVLDRLVRPRTR